MPSSGVGTFTNPTTVWSAAGLLNNDGGQSLRVSYNLPWYRTSDYATVNALAAAAGAGPYNIIVDAHRHVTANLALGVGIHVVYEPDFIIEVDNGVTWTIHSPEHVVCPLRQRAFTLTGTGIVAFANGGVVYPGWWGAVGDGATDDSGAIQDAMDAVLATAMGGTVRFPSADYAVQTGLVIPAAAPPIRLDSLQGLWYTTQLTATANITAIIDFTAGGTTSQLYSVIADLWFDGGGVADYCIRNDDGPYMMIQGCRLCNAAVAAVLLEDCWGSVIRDTMITTCVDGIWLGKAANGCLIDKCTIYANTGIGIRVNGTGGSSNGVTIRGCIIESNEITGVYAWYARNLTIRDSYFEANGATGWSITVPGVMTITASIILNGDVSGNGMSPVQPCRDVVVEDCYVNSRAAATASIYACSCYDLAVMNLYEARTGVPIIGTYGTHASGRIDGLEMAGCYTDDLDVEITGGLGTASTDKQYVHTWRIDRRDVANIFSQSFLTWTQSGAAGSTIGPAREIFRGQDVVDIYDSNSASDYFQLALDFANDYPHLRGKYLWFGCWFKYTSGSADTGFALKTPNGDDSSSLYASTGDWQFRSRAYYVDPAAGVLTFGVRKLGSADVHMYVVGPFLCEAGRPYDEVLTGEVRLAAAAMPTTGYYRAGDVVLNSAPALDGNNLAIYGWLRLVTGTAHVSGTDWAIMRVSHVSPCT